MRLEVRVNPHRVDMFLDDITPEKVAFYTTASLLRARARYVYAQQLRASRIWYKPQFKHFTWKSPEGSGEALSREINLEDYIRL